MCNHMEIPSCGFSLDYTGQRMTGIQANLKLMFFFYEIGNERRDYSYSETTLLAGTLPQARHPPCPPQRLTYSHGTSHRDLDTWT